MAKYFTDPAAWQELLSGDFNRGYLSGVMLVLSVVVLLLVIRLVLSFIFRNRRVRSIVVPAADGDVMISRNAVVAAVENMLTGFPELMVDSLRIYRRGRMYFFQLHCRFRSGDSAVFPDIVQKVKEAVFSGMQEQFGVNNLRKIRIVLTELDRAAAEKKQKVEPVPAPEDAPVVTEVSSADPQ